MEKSMLWVIGADGDIWAFIAVVRLHLLINPCACKCCYSRSDVEYEGALLENACAHDNLERAWLT